MNAPSCPHYRAINPNPSPARPQLCRYKSSGAWMSELRGQTKNIALGANEVRMMIYVRFG